MIHGVVRPSACPDPETLGALAEGRLGGAERDDAVRHLASCRRCHEVFASSLAILEEEGLLPAVEDAAAAPRPRRPMMAWLSAAAAALVSAVLFVQRAPVTVPRMVEAPPTPAAVATPAATASPEPVRTASLPPEAVEALRTLGGFASPFEPTPSVAFAPNPRGRVVALGIADVDAAARALKDHAAVPPLGGDVDDWRRVGRILEASRLALLDREGRPDTFFATRWAAAELADASRTLHAARVRDAVWLDEVRTSPPRDGAGAQRMLERLDALLRALQ